MIKNSIGILVIALLLFSGFQIHAQQVETVGGPVPRVNNGLIVDSSGTIYTSDLFGSGFNGTRVHTFSPTGTSQLLADGLTRPAGLAFDASGTLYVAEFSSNEISTIDTGGTVTLFASGLSSPSDLVFDPAGNLFVTNYGNGTISKITPSGTVSTFATGLSQPVGLAMDTSQTLYAASLNTGWIYRIDMTGAMDSLARVADLPVGFMTYAKGNLYLCSTGGHRIYKITLGGAVSTFAGSGIAGTQDGAAGVAQFTNPDGIAVSPTGDTLYVSENNTQLLRRILLDTGTWRDTDEELGMEMLDQNYPNPFVGKTRIGYRVERGTEVRLRVLDAAGREVQVLVDATQEAGAHEVEWDASEVEAGVYMYELEVGGARGRKRCVVLGR